MNADLSNKRKKRNIKPPSQIQGDNSRAEVRQVNTRSDVSAQRSNYAGGESLVHITNLQTRQDNSMGNAKVNYERQRLEDQRNGTELYSIWCYDCD